MRLGSFRWSNLLVGFGVRLRLRCPLVLYLPGFCGRCSFFFYGDVEDGYSGEKLFERLNDVFLVCVELYGLFP